MNLLVKKKKQLNQKKITKKEIRNVTAEILEIICEKFEKCKIICYKENLCNILFLLIFLSGKAEIIRNVTQ